jgi:hypothetical protein
MFSKLLKGILCLSHSTVLQNSFKVSKVSFDQAGPMSVNGNKLMFIKQSGASNVPTTAQRRTL